MNHDKPIHFEHLIFQKEMTRVSPPTNDPETCKQDKVVIGTTIVPRTVFDNSQNITLCQKW